MILIFHSTRTRFYRIKRRRQTEMHSKLRPEYRAVYNFIYFIFKHYAWVVVFCYHIYIVLCIMILCRKICLSHNYINSAWNMSNLTQRSRLRYHTYTIDMTATFIWDYLRNRHDCYYVLLCSQKSPLRPFRYVT